jgi:3-methylcrotonyl-CoA carboxylase alpha subunit
VAEPLGNGRYRIAGVRESGLGIRTATLAYAVREDARTWVFIDGRTYVIDAAAPRSPARGSAADDQVALAAPMPATVVAINAAPGQEVHQGDLLVMLEAMKMELPITAPRDGRVKAIGCRVGELVQAGVPLVVLE